MTSDLSVIDKVMVGEINTYGYPFTIDEYGYLFIDLPHAKVIVDKKPSYFDRGRFGFTIEVKPEHRDKLTIDFADCFPRYFFSIQRAFDEMNDWIILNSKNLGIK